MKNFSSCSKGCETLLVTLEEQTIKTFLDISQKEHLYLEETR
jgi:hypothetical protein